MNLCVCLFNINNILYSNFVNVYVFFFQLYQQKGRQGELKNKIKELRRTLEADAYKNAEDKYQAELIKLRVSLTILF